MDSPRARTASDAGAPEIRTLADSVFGVLAAWLALFEAEATLAKRSLRALAIAALVAPVLLLGVWFSTIALLVIVLHASGLDWLPSTAAGCGFQLAMIIALFYAMRRWSRDLSMRRTRAVLTQLLEPTP